MSSVAVLRNINAIVDALVEGDSATANATIKEVVTRAEDSSEVLGQLGLIAMRGDPDGHAALTLSAASELTRWLIALRHILGEDSGETTYGLPLVFQAARAVQPAIKAGREAQPAKISPRFPGSLGEKGSVGAALDQAITAGDVQDVESLLLGLYGTGADYRALSIRIYDAIAQRFQEGGHGLLLAARGSQVLDAAEWSEDAPAYIHWLTPHITQTKDEPTWIQDIRTFLSDSKHSLASYRTRLAAPQNAQTISLRDLILSKANTTRVAQGVYDALITNGGSSQAVASVIALAASDLLSSVDPANYEQRTHVAHGLLFASAVRLVYTQVQEVEALPLLFTAAGYVNALVAESGQINMPAEPHNHPGGGLIAPALLESLSEQLTNDDLSGALATSHRYIQLGYDPHALFAVIGIAAANYDAASDQGHILQIVLAAGEEYLHWPTELKSTNHDSFLLAALHAVTSPA